MANFVFAKAKESLWNKEIDWDSDTIEACLVKFSYTPNQATHQYVSDLGANRAGTDITLSGKTNTGGVLDANDVKFSSHALSLGVWEF
ncbi:hypothetical protein V5E97_32680 [Singulisphaera sp. Ch08]|uniref:Uncharacterized protein n=1 Tax=Singulisphaera sp. Ch08 TaxID=3120278 RepID=A0AAU7CCX1_9BACT